MDKNTESTPQTITNEQQADHLADQTQISSSRRRFAQSVAGSGVILSLASKPVMGANYWCTGSGGMSGNTSSHGVKLACLACSPGYWKTSPGTWPVPYYPHKVCKCTGNNLSTVHEATTFFEAFGAGPTSTMMSILQTRNGSREWIAIGALLNAAKGAAMGVATAYTVNEVRQMYLNSAPASTLSSTWEGNLHNCPLPNDNGSVYLAESLPFCNIIDSNGSDTGTANHC